MPLNAHLHFNGQCEAAFRFYEKCFDGRIAFMGTYGGSPLAAEMPVDLQHRIMHATLILPDGELTGADTPPDRYQKPQGFALTLSLETPAEAERVFAGLAEHGEVQLPVQETFWAERFGMLLDRFGIPWMIQCAKLAHEP
jgi:PhnB protein